MSVALVCSATLVTGYATVYTAATSPLTVAHTEVTSSQSGTEINIKSVLQDRLFNYEISQYSTETGQVRSVKYPGWLIASFPMSLGTLTLGFLSAFYVIFFGRSPLAVIGSYLIPLSITALYCMLGVAESISADKND